MVYSRGLGSSPKDPRGRLPTVDDRFFGFLLTDSKSSRSQLLKFYDNNEKISPHSFLYTSLSSRSLLIGPLFLVTVSLSIFYNSAVF